ncbi:MULTISPECIES: glycogen synthase [unclassified Curtobacterium]|uniref:glycogen synthase n=1 Tax=unclassified Curtobacterium TaxID=257496 RepID=UPI0008DE61FF|nr:MULTISPECIES: glycogen synthase [unclassified Curtobacterium]OIH98678.1 glycosyl transferase family 1 [Curtobacterium sp. MCBA15_003]OII32402.1 glycosyl transferase family 1 [Curtobacterium sp. MMLR14_006]WIE63460.1 glycogen synthase [Curtobacterium sp. MCLR17_036]
MRVDLLTREYPPEVYGGAGVHVAELTSALRSGTDTEVRVRAFGAFRDEADVWAYRTPAGLEQANGALQALGTDVAIAADVEGADLVHSHTWYANAAGRIAQLTHGIPHVVTAHSLEPLRPWKAEQLGGGYRLSSWMEREAFEQADGVIAVSKAMRADILRSYPSIDPAKVHVVYNGIDIDEWKPTVDEDAVRALGIDPSRPSVVFVGRITRQKGLPYLLRAVASLPAEVQIVLCAGAPDTPEIMAEVTGLVEGLREQREGVVWIDRMLEHREIVNVLSSGTVFVCPSVYEPLGIVNLEAMACGIPVVGTGTGGIPEVVADGLTGRIVPIDQVQDGTGTPTDPDRFVADLAATLTEVLADEGLAKLMGRAGRLRVETEFTWDAIATRTRQVYDEVLARTP